MTNLELRAWITKRALTIAAAAEMLGLSKSGLHRQLSGERAVSEQTRQLCQLWDAYNGKEPKHLTVMWDDAYHGKEPAK